MNACKNVIINVNVTVLTILSWYKIGWRPYDDLSQKIIENRHFLHFLWLFEVSDKKSDALALTIELYFLSIH